MTVAVLGAKTILAVMLLIAGGAKLADLAGFAVSVRLFAPPALARTARARSAGRAIALIVALGELAAGAASLTAPGIGWLNLVVLGVGCAFVVVSAAGYVFHRGRSCRCFGALSQRKFDLAGLARAAAIAALAGLATRSVPAASIALGLTDHGLLLAASCLLALVAYVAARGLAASRSAVTGMVP